MRAMSSFSMPISSSGLSYSAAFSACPSPDLAMATSVSKTADAPASHLFTGLCDCSGDVAAVRNDDVARQFAPVGQSGVKPDWGVR